MIRMLAALLVTFAMLSSAQASIPALHLGGGKNADPKAPAESRQKIIDEMQAGYEKVLERLKMDDPGAETRRNQQRILDGFDELLKQRDPNSGKSASSNPPPTPMNPANPLGEPKPDPKQGVGNPDRPKPAAEPKQAPQPDAQPAAAKAKPAVGKDVDRSNTPDAVRQEQKGGGIWGHVSLRHRMEMEAHAHERFMQRYEETLRAYYRSIAESSRDKD